jgi:hypothetical protein
MCSLLAMKALPEILRFPLVLIISLIPLWTFAACTGFTAITTNFATHLCKEQSFWSEPILSLDFSFFFDKLRDDLIWRGHHCGVFVHHELQDDFPFVVPWDSAKEIEDVLLLTQFGDYLSSFCISVSRQWRSTQIVIVAFPIDPRCIVVDISAVLLHHAPKVFPNLEDVELLL